jgi:predicted AAA+ superfamily ATPase
VLPRFIFRKITGKFDQNRAIVVLGPRQSGKATLLKMLASTMEDDYVWFNGDDPSDASLLEGSSAERLKSLIGRKRFIFIDEAQEIRNIGRTVKLITDSIHNVCPIISGSSAFELSNRLNEPLAGRKSEFHLFPMAFSELAAHHGLKSEIQQLESRMVFGSYPEIVVNQGAEKELLAELTTSYLYKDIFKYGGIRKPKELEKIVKLLAWQAGSEVNISEMAGEAGISPVTVERYIDLLEKAFIVFELPAFARNLRNEIKKNRKVYFFDNGIRNTLIGNLSPLENRNDVGTLWENYLVSERMKVNSYTGFYGYSYFWRTQQQQEIDYLEELDGRLNAFEFKWNPHKRSRFPLTFTRSYPEASTTLVSRDNYEDFLSLQP